MLHNLGLLAGIAVTAAGLAILNSLLAETKGRRLAQVGLLGFLGTTAIWIVIAAIHLSMLGTREASDAPRLFPAAMDGWLTQTFTGLLLASLIIYGVALLQSGWPLWVGIATVLLSGLMLVAFLFLGD